jgi:hypothetical protein
MSTSMEHDFPTDGRLRQYLLNQLDEDARAHVERQYLTDGQLFERLVLAEDELIDAYVADALPLEDRQRFETAFLSTSGRRERVAFARSLREVVSQADRADAPAAAGIAEMFVAWLRGGSPWRWATAALAVTLLLGGSWLAVDRARLNGALAGSQAELARRTRELQQQVEAERTRADDLAAARDRAPLDPGGQPSGTGSPTRSPLVATFALAPRLTRNGEATMVPVEGGTALVRLQLQLETNTHPRYRPRLTTVAGDEVWSQQAVPARTTRDGIDVGVELPASLLESRDYVLTLDGVRQDGVSEEVAAYSFRVSRP